MAKLPITLHEDNTSRVVQLSGEYNTGWGTGINELKAAFYAQGPIELHRFKNDDEPGIARFTLSREEIDALLSAWETFQAEQQLKKLAEQKRLADVIAEAHALVTDLPIEIIEESENDSEWRIHSESINTIRYHAYHADQLLERTKMAVKDYERYQVERAIHDEIATIKQACPSIRIRGNHAPWHVTIESPDLYGEYARTPEEMLERVKAAKAKYERWQLDQAIIQQEDDTPVTK